MENSLCPKDLTTSPGPIQIGGCSTQWMRQRRKRSGIVIGRKGFMLLKHAVYRLNCLLWMFIFVLNKISEERYEWIAKRLELVSFQLQKLYLDINILLSTTLLVHLDSKFLLVIKKKEVVSHIILKSGKRYGSWETHDHLQTTTYFVICYNMPCLLLCF